MEIPVRFLLAVLGAVVRCADGSEKDSWKAKARGQTRCEAEGGHTTVDCEVGGHGTCQRGAFV